MKLKRAVQVALPILMKQTPGAASLDSGTREVVVRLLAKILVEAAAQRDEAGNEHS